MSVNRKENRAGFTLVELLVVIGIIAVLVGLLLPALNKARNSAMIVKCAANERVIGQAFFQYATQFKGALPTFYTNNPDVTQNIVTNSSWDYLLEETVLKF